MSNSVIGVPKDEGMDIILPLTLAGPSTAKEIGVSKFRLDRLITLGLVEIPKTEPTRKHVDAEGNALPGRPATVYRASSKARARARRRIESDRKARAVAEAALREYHANNTTEAATA